MLLTDAELQALRSFVRDDLEFGSLTFDFPDPESDTTPRGTIPVKIQPIESGRDGAKNIVAISLDLQPS